MGQRKSSSFSNDDSSSISDTTSNGSHGVSEERDNDPCNPFCIGIIGTGEVGKSTLIKNFKYALNSYSQTHYDIEELRRNLYYMMKNCIAQLSNEERYLYHGNINSDYEKIKQFIPCFKTPNVYSSFLNRHLYHFPLENFETLLGKVDNIQKLDIGFQEDLESYWLTTGIPEYRINSNLAPNRTVVILDSEGQRCGRKKWKYVFEHHLNCLVYVISLSEFNQNCFEDDTLNRLTDSLDCFKKIISNESFPTKIPLYILFSKVDVLERKINNGFSIDGAEPIKPFSIFGKSNISTDSCYFPVTNLNEDILSEIFKFLNPSDLFSVMQTCKQFNLAANREVVWFFNCKYHHPHINYRFAMKTFEEMTRNQLDSIDEENNIFKVYYKNRGFLVQKSIQYIQNMYMSCVPSSITCVKTFVMNLIDSNETKKAVLQILRNERVIS